MPELPEIRLLARDMQTQLAGKRIAAVWGSQPKCLNKDLSFFQRVLPGTHIQQISQRGKWLQINLGELSLLLNLGMGGDLIYYKTTPCETKYQFRLEFDDNSGLTLRFWWFGHIHLVNRQELTIHPYTTKIGPDAFPMKLSTFLPLLAAKKRQGVKSFLLNQANISGIGNFYIHDILFVAGIHPQQKIAGLKQEKQVDLHRAIQTVLANSLDKGGASYEKDFYGKAGGFTEKDLVIAYQAGNPCPKCGTIIKKIKTGSTSHFLCPTCQAAPPNHRD